MTNKFTFPLRNYQYDIISYEPILIKHRLTKFELLCAIEQIYIGANYFKHTSMEQSMLAFTKNFMVLSIILCFIGYLVGLVAEDLIFIAYIIG